MATLRPLPYESMNHFLELLVIGLAGWMPRKPGILLRRWLYPSILRRMGEAASIERGCEFFGACRIAIGSRVFVSHNTYFEATAQTSEIVVGDDVKLADNVRLSNGGEGGRIHLRDRVILDRGADIRPHKFGTIDIGEGTYIGPYSCLAGPGSIQIGASCLIASHTGIYANNHNFADATRLITEQGLNSKGIVIEDDCWLGTGVKILDGVRIGHGCVIGAGAVVTKDLPPLSVAVGVPAKVIDRRSAAAVKTEVIH